MRSTRVLVFFLLLSFFALSPPRTAAQTAPARAASVVSFSQRARDAALQLQRYRERIASEKNQVQSAAGAKPQVEVSFRKDLQTAATIFFYDDMESGTNGWSTEIHGDSGSVWHQTVRDANSPTHSWWNGIEWQGDYNSGHRVNAAIVSPTINLASAVGPVTLLFTENYETESGWDYCMVDVTTDGGTTWHPLRGDYAHSASGSSYGWKISTLDLSPFAGSSLNIRFYFDTGDSLFNNFPGWSVDNVAVFDHSGGISGTVYFDWNQNGLFDSSERGLNDWFVRATGPVTITMRSHWSGVYLFTLPLATYQVSELVSDPWTQTAPSGSVWTVDVAIPGQTEIQKDFGNYRPGTYITGRAFDDVNRDSIWNGGEPPLQNHKILMYNPFGSQFATQSDSAGNYSFLVFNVGTYRVVDYLTGGRISTVPGGSGEYWVTVTGMNQTLTGNDFGSYQLANSGVISGILFNDVDRNGAREVHEPYLAGSLVTLGLGDWRAYSTVDDSGRFQFGGLLPGTYAVWAGMDYTWRQSTPDTVCTIHLSEAQIVSDIVLGVYRLPVGSIKGVVFNDLNRNGVKDSLEPALPGWTVASVGPEPANWLYGQRRIDVDSTGSYLYTDMLTGLHRLFPICPLHWRTSLPSGESDITLSEGENRDTVNLGVYLLRTGSIGGLVFNDANLNRTLDSGEVGLQDREVQLSGSQSASTTTDDSGRFRIDGLWAGSYKVNMNLQSHWRQTSPDSLQPYFITLGDEEDNGALNFGIAYDTAFTISFRTFLPESLALSVDAKGKMGPVLPKADRCLFRYSFVNTDSSAAATLAITLKLASRLETLTTSRGDLTTDARGIKLYVAFSPPLPMGDSVIVYGVSAKAGRQMIRAASFSYEDVSISPPGRVTEMLNTLAYPRPNALNALYAGAGVNLRIGKGGPHSVVHPSYKDVMKSLYDRHGGPVVGPPCCIGTYTDVPWRTIRKQVKYLPPTKQNNRMFSEAIALKTNIRSSELWITPPGFGKLIFQDTSANWCNGMSVSAIASKLDTLISAFDDRRRVRNPDGTSAWVGGDTCIYGRDFFARLFRTVRIIDSAFSGPIDTVSFGRGLVFAPARSLSEIRFLHLDSSFATMGAFAERPIEPPPLPEQFTLSQNYPNPFNPSTTIEFNLAQESFVTLRVYNALGQLVATLIDHERTADGWTQTEFSADEFRLASGVYFYRLVAEPIGDDDQPGGQTFTSVRKMMLLK